MSSLRKCHFPKSPQGSPSFSEKNSVWGGFLHQWQLGNSVTCAQELQKSVRMTSGLWLLRLRAAYSLGVATAPFMGIVAAKSWASRLWFCVQDFKEREKCQHRQIQVSENPQFLQPMCPFATSSDLFQEHNFLSPQQNSSAQVWGLCTYLFASTFFFFPLSLATWHRLGAW